MKCSIDKTDMEKGYFGEGHWISGDRPKLSGIKIFGRNAKWGIVWRCSKCGKLEFYTQPDK